MAKSIEIVKRRVGDLTLDFGNPRKIKKQKREDLEESLEKYGDFDIIVINENNQVIGGNQRVTILQRKDPNLIVDCKMLVGYTTSEQKYVNIKLNSHAGEWDLDELGDWTADLMGSFKLDLEKPEKPIEERNIKDKEAGITCNVHYKPLPMMTAYKKCKFNIADYPNAYAMYKSLLTLPYFSDMTEEMRKNSHRC